MTPDFLPLAGPTEAAGVFVLSGLGSRGFCSAAPLLAEHVAALALGAPPPLAAALAEIVHPGRFVMRRKRRLAFSQGSGATPSDRGGRADPTHEGAETLCQI